MERLRSMQTQLFGLNTYLGFPSEYEFVDPRRKSRNGVRAFMVEIHDMSTIGKVLPLLNQSTFYSRSGRKKAKRDRSLRRGTNSDSSDSKLPVLVLLAASDYFTFIDYSTNTFHSRWAIADMQDMGIKVVNHADVLAMECPS